MKRSLGKFFRVLLGITGLLLVTAVFVVLAVMAVKPEKDKQGEAFTVTETEPVEPVTAMDTRDIMEWARAFGSRVPALSGEAGVGQVLNAAFEGRTARMATFDYGTVSVACVRPAAAAALLLRSGLSVSLRSDISVQSMPALYAADGNQRCLYFSDENAAYSFYAPDMGEEAFFALAALVTMVR